MRFFVGLHHASDAKHFGSSFISVNAIRKRKSAFTVSDWIMDSGAFTEIAQYGGYRERPSVYAAQIRRWCGNGNLLAAVAQDYMCEPYALNKTGLTISEHQRLTIERYDSLLSEDCGSVYIMPVLQGYEPDAYLQHIESYGKRLQFGAWVGVGTICKRQGSPMIIAGVLRAIKNERPDLRLHAFGVKITALKFADIRDRLYSADSMAWSFAGRKIGKPNDPKLAMDYVKRVNEQSVQMYLIP
jgi:hypothetical protein